MMRYKGYIATVDFDEDANLFHGEIVNIKDVVTFQGQSADELKQAFHDSVDDYLALCEERGESPDKPFSGKFMTRVSPELHRKLFVEAKSAGKSLNAWISEKLEHEV